MRGNDTAPTGLALFLILVVVVFLLVMRVMEKPIIPPDGSTTAAPSSLAAPAQSSTDPSFVPYWYPTRRGWAVRDLWNRDPVCHGDPVCRDAYFRDWPHARRPDSHRRRREDSSRPIHITVTSPSSATASPTINVNGSPSSTDEVSAGGMVAASGPVGSVDAIMASSGLASPEDLVEDSYTPDPAVEPGLPAVVVEADGSGPIADEATVRGVAGKRAGGSVRSHPYEASADSSCPSNRAGVTSCGGKALDVFPAGMDLGMYSL